MSRVVRHLIRTYWVVYAWFWGIVAVLLTVFMSSLGIFGPWPAENDVGQGSLWMLFGNQTPQWFLFVIGIILATTSLPVAIAHGVTRREFCGAAGIFALGSAVLFGLFVLLGFGVEYVVYQAYGVMDVLKLPYPAPTIGGFLTILAAHVAQMATGWVAGLCFYRLPVWWAIAAMPAVALLMAGVWGPPVPGDEVLLSALSALVAVVAAYLIARGLAVRPKKA